MLKRFCGPDHLLSPPVYDKHFFQVKDYYKIIKCPMDLQTIQNKSNRYANPSKLHWNSFLQFNNLLFLDELFADVQLVFDNCHHYNSARSEVAKAANGLKEYFLDLVTTNSLQSYLPVTKGRRNYWPWTHTCNPVVIPIYERFVRYRKFFFLFSVNQSLWRYQKRWKFFSLPLLYSLIWKTTLIKSSSPNWKWTLILWWLIWHGFDDLETGYLIHVHILFSLPVMVMIYFTIFLLLLWCLSLNV